MKLLRTLLFLGLAVMPVSGSDIARSRAEETGRKYKVYGANNGQVYRDVMVTNITDAGITIVHADGMARLGFDSLSPTQRETFGITREAAEAIYAEEMKARAAYEAQVAAKEKERQAAQQKALEVQLAEQTAARLEAERLKALRALEQQAAEPQDATSIVSALEVPRFPVLRGYDSQVLQPIQNDSRPQRSRYYRSSGTTYPVYYGGAYGYSGRGYPVRYGGVHCYPTGGSYYRPSYHRGSWGWINYRGSKFNIGLRW